MVCRFCRGQLYEWSLRFSKVTTTMVEKLQSYGFSRTGYTFLKAEPDKACCPLYETKVDLKEYEPNK